MPRYVYLFVSIKVGTILFRYQNINTYTNYSYKEINSSSVRRASVADLAKFLIFQAVGILKIKALKTHGNKNITTYRPFPS